MAIDITKEQIKIDGDAITNDKPATKDEIKDQIIKQVDAEAKAGKKLLLHWKRQAGTGRNYPYIVPIWLSIALEVDLSKVCECICELIIDTKVSAITNIPRPITASVLEQFCLRWDAVNKNPAKAGKVDSKMALAPIFGLGSGKKSVSLETITDFLL